MNKQFLYEEPLANTTLAIPVYTDKANTTYANPDNCTAQSMEAMCASVARSKYREFTAPSLTTIQTIPLDTTSFAAWAKAHKFTDTAIATQFAYARNATEKQSMSLWKNNHFAPVVKVCVLAVNFTDGMPVEKIDKKVLKALNGLLRKVSGLKGCKLFIPSKVYSSQRLYADLHKHLSEAAKAFDVRSSRATLNLDDYMPQLTEDYYCIPVYVLEPNVFNHKVNLLYSTHSSSLKVDKNALETLFKKNGLANMTLCWDYLFPAYAIPAVFTLTHLIDSDAFYDVAALATRICMKYANENADFYLNMAPLGDALKVKVVSIDNPGNVSAQDKVLKIVDEIKAFMINGGGFLHVDVDNNVYGYAVDVINGVRPMSAEDASRCFNFGAHEHNNPGMNPKDFKEDSDLPELNVGKADVRKNNDN